MDKKITSNNIINKMNYPDNGKIAVKKEYNRTRIFIPKDKVYKLVGFLKHEIFDDRAGTQIIKDFVNVREIVLERLE